MPTQATEPQELDKHPAAGDTTTSMREVVVVVVVGDGQDKMTEVLAARAVETGAARATAEVAAMAVKETSAGRTAVVVEDMEEEEEEEEVTDSNLEHTEAADTTHKARAAGTASKAKVVGTISKLRVVVRTASNRRATIPTGNKAAMTLSLALEDRTPRRHRYFSRYPIASLLLQLFTERDRFVQQGRSARQIPMASLRRISSGVRVSEACFLRRQQDLTHTEPRVRMCKPCA
jgi:hypothetical protein